jgi:outer membrane lipoprotein LolB
MLRETRNRLFVPVYALLIAAGLSGCAPFMGDAVAPRLPEAQQQLYRINAWKLEGRIAVKAGNEGWNANLFWEHEDGQDRLRIYGPFSQGAVSIIVQSDLVYINEGNGVVSSSREPDALLKKKLGFTVPLRSMRYWVLGLPAPDTDYHAQADGKGGFEQQGWALDFTRFEHVGQFVMPQKMTIRGNAVSLKLVVDEWVFKN